MKINWSRPNIEGFVECYTFPGIFIERHEVYETRESRYNLVLDINHVANFRTLAEAKAFLQRACDLTGPKRHVHTKAS